MLLPGASPCGDLPLALALDLVSSLLFLGVFVFFLCVFTPLGDSLAASGRQALALSGGSDRDGDPNTENAFSEWLNQGRQQWRPVPWNLWITVLAKIHDGVAISPEKEMFRERHFPPQDQNLLYLIPPPLEYKIPLPWPESLQKIISDQETGRSRGFGFVTFNDEQLMRDTIKPEKPGLPMSLLNMVGICARQGPIINPN